MMRLCNCNISTLTIFLYLVACFFSSTTKGDYKSEFMRPQNAARRATRAGLAPLVWDAKLENYALTYAKTRRGDCALQHSGGPYGENIFWGSGDGSGWPPAQASSDWASEVKYYHYSDNSCDQGHECGHYTQIVWRETKRIGCARVVCFNNKGVFMICSYDPPGNYIGEKPY
ncbi:CAP (Cysteine-rich secretory proteins- Antigen 5-and Pathogenesis-related 1 protein) superfamily protein [Striga hermonthica]|uniref:CAP (Cysteine-rich secretory proteins- Antigen 5-and Pathogenesis-related 1 protein) superfamily protein n=1 Tax=Striga hermonthica TaxID=68872 RepID=A0A9N7RPL5_STRHE|nr:CAP (Cysteine-rich secretory proteins- Antigen 5-and Pathogenesis-related 1 protein) superfamily protein [Striga hermonthica]